MKTFDDIKSTYRICQIGNHYYIQEKTYFGWSYDTGSTWITKYPNWPGFLEVLTLILTAISIILLVIAIFSPAVLGGLVVFAIASIISWFSYIILTLNSKSLSVVEHSYYSANSAVDKIVNKKLRDLKISEEYEEKRLKEKVTKKEKKYHYFYTEKQMRAEKLKKLKKL
jgi:hypothetical protein